MSLWPMEQATRDRDVVARRQTAFPPLNDTVCPPVFAVENLAKGDRSNDRNHDAAMSSRSYSSTKLVKVVQYNESETFL